MNALARLIDAEGFTPAIRGTQLFGASQRIEVALSDPEGCSAFLRAIHPAMRPCHRRAARRVAIDLASLYARRPDAALVEACREALARTERAKTGELSMAEALAEISDVVAAALGASGVGPLS